MNYPTYGDPLRQLHDEGPDYTILGHHIERLKTIAEISGCGITVFDSHRRRHAFVSYNFTELFGYDLAAIEREDAEYFTKHIHPDDIEDLDRLGAEGVRFANEHKETARDIKMINEYRINTVQGCVRVIEQFQILEFDRHGDVWLTLSTLDISPDQRAKNGVRNCLVNYKTGEVYRQWQSSSIQNEQPVLSVREREILQLVGKGMLSKEIAAKLSLSVHTVNTHRQRILEKLNADNSMEAIRYASMHGLLD
ncbi:MAG: LuxR family transcriptional regulator [Alistipes sp.]|nr:LuxR family transcriptional regulator [Alistipes sp.]